MYYSFFFCNLSQGTGDITSLDGIGPTCSVFPYRITQFRLLNVYSWHNRFHNRFPSFHNRFDYSIDFSNSFLNPQQFNDLISHRQRCVPASSECFGILHLLNSSVLHVFWKKNSFLNTRYGSGINRWTCISSKLSWTLTATFTLVFLHLLSFYSAI